MTTPNTPYIADSSAGSEFTAMVFGSLAAARVESSIPVAYRLTRDTSGALHLQGAFQWHQGSDGGIEWRVIPTVELT